MLAQTKLFRFIAQTALSACVYMISVRQGCWSVPVSLINESFLQLVISQKQLLIFYLQGLFANPPWSAALKSQNQQTATGKNMLQLIVNEKCANFFFPFSELLTRKIKIASSSELVTDLRCQKFKSEHKQSTLKPPNTKTVNGKMSKVPVRFQMAF